MPRLVRKSFFVEPAVLRRLRRALGARSEAEALRQVARWYVESESVKDELFVRSAGSLKASDFEPDAT